MFRFLLSPVDQCREHPSGVRGSAASHRRRGAEGSNACLSGRLNWLFGSHKNAVWIKPPFALSEEVKIEGG